MEITTLYFTQDGSDKMYQAAIVPSGGRFLVNFNYGRRGAAMQTGCKTKFPVSLSAAQALYHKIIEEKKAKGYTPNPDGAPQMPAVQVSKHASLTIPTFPARPVNGGDLTLALPKLGHWHIEPKYNEWRALIHLPTGTMFNRKGTRLSIEKEFASAIAVLREALGNAADCGRSIDWIDGGALERRHSIGRGTLMVFDFLPLSDRSNGVDPSTTYLERRHHLRELPVLSADEQPAHHHAYLVPSYDADDLDGRKALHIWHRLQYLNELWHTSGLNSFYEGIVMKRVDSIYPMQLRSPDFECPLWMKHRFV
jgi:predicted DNA-binding WGR domain protein